MTPDQKYIYEERIAIMREGNRIPDNQPTPFEFHRIAKEQALAVQVADSATSNLVSASESKER